MEPDWHRRPGAFASTPPLHFIHDTNSSSAARLGVGVRKDGALVVIGVEGVAGKPAIEAKAYAEGATLSDLGILLESEGCIEAINLDGGGSMQMFLGTGSLVTPADRRITQIASYDRFLSTALSFQ